MILAVCSMCGFTIDVFGKEDNTPVREKRLKYLLTRDQVCPNCLVSISKCQKVEGEEEAIPSFSIAVDESLKPKLKAFALEKGYGVVTEYMLNQFRESGETVIVGDDTAEAGS